MWSNHRRSSAVSSGSFQTMNGRVFRLGRVLEVVDVRAHHLAVDDQVALPVQHVRDHEHLVELGVGKLQRQLRGLDVERAHAHLTARQ
jgi:hypothetical protein